MKRSRLFLPLLIDIWGGIEKYQAGDRSSMHEGKRRYIPFYQSHISTILGILKHRLARSGRFPVDAANELIWMACLRYSGAASRSYAAAKIDGFGVVVMNRYGNPDASVSKLIAIDQQYRGMSSVCPYSSLGTRRVPLWEKWEDAAKEASAARIPFVRMDGTEACRFCGAPVHAYRFRKKHSDYFCRKPECRHMAWLWNQPQKRGGIDLTPTQRKTTATQLWDQVRVLNYLNAKAKQAGRKRNVRNQAG